MPDKQLLLQFALVAFDGLTALVAGLDDATATSDPGLPGCRSPQRILTDSLEVLRIGEPHAEPEPTASGAVHVLLARAAEARAAFVDDVAALAPDAAALLGVAGELYRQLGHLEAARDALLAGGRVRQLRLVVEADDYDRALGFYRDVVGLPQTATYPSAGPGDARGVLLDAGRATLELNTPAQKRAIDVVEVGHPTDSPIRVALQVPDAERATSQFVDAGALVVGPPTATPWGSVNARLQAPAGLELTVFHQR